MPRGKHPAIAAGMDRLLQDLRHAVRVLLKTPGFRVALGATNPEILQLVLVDALKPVAGGLVVGLAAAFVLARALQGLVFGVSPTDPLTFLSLPVVLGVVAFLASLGPALRATRVDPLEALRMD